MKGKYRSKEEFRKHKINSTTIKAVKEYLEKERTVSLNKMINDLNKKGIDLNWFEAVEVVRRLGGKFYIE